MCELLILLVLLLINFRQEVSDLWIGGQVNSICIQERAISVAATFSSLASYLALFFTGPTQDVVVFGVRVSRQTNKLVRAIDESNWITLSRAYGFIQLRDNR